MLNRSCVNEPRKKKHHTSHIEYSEQYKWIFEKLKIYMVFLISSSTENYETVKQMINLKTQSKSKVQHEHIQCVKILCVILFQYWTDHFSLFVFLFFLSIFLLLPHSMGFWQYSPFLCIFDRNKCLWYHLQWTICVVAPHCRTTVFVSSQLLTWEILFHSDHLSFWIKKRKKGPKQSRWFLVTIQYLFCCFVLCCLSFELYLINQFFFM